MHSLFARSHAHVLRRQDGASLCFHYASKPYLIAFPTASLAVKIAKNTNQPDAIRLTQHVTTNLFANMSAAERAYWNALMAADPEEGTVNDAIAAPTDAFHVNFAGCLTFSKRVMPVTDMCAPDEIRMDALLEYPFAHNLGRRAHPQGHRRERREHDDRSGHHRAEHAPGGLPDLAHRVTLRAV